MLPIKFRFNWPNGFRGEESKKSANQKQGSPVAAMLVNGSGRNQHSLQRTFHRCFLPSFGSFGQAVSEEKIFKNLCRDKCILNTYLYLNKSYLSFHRRYFRNQPIWNKNCLWWPCLVMDRDEISTLYRGPPIDASYQVSVHLAKWFQRRRILKISQSETRVACGGHAC
jgi:hypothetical protein